MADIELSVGFDQSKVDAEIKRLEREIKSIESSIKFAEKEAEKYAMKRMELYAEAKINNKDVLNDYKDQAFLEKQEQKQIDILKNKLVGLRDARLKAMYEPAVFQAELNANKKIEEQIKEQIRLQKRLKAQKDVTSKKQITADVSKTGVRAGILSKADDEVGFLSKIGGKAGIASKAVQGLGSAFTTVLSIVGRLASRVVGLIKNVLIFSVITMGLRELREYIGNVVSSNDQLANSLAVVKMNLATAFSAIYTAVLPALQTFIDWLGKATAFLAAFIARIFGSSYKAAQRTAKSFNRQATATKNLTKETKKLGKELTKVLASFDELNVLSNEISDKQEQDDTPVAPSEPTTPGTPEPVMPDYSDEIEKAERFADRVKQIFSEIYTRVKTNPFVNWTISELIPKTLNAIGSAINFIKEAFGPLKKPLKDLYDNVIKPFAENIGGKVTEALDGIKTAFDDLTKTIKDNKKELENIFGFIVKVIIHFYQKYVEPVINTVWSGVKRVVGWIWPLILGLIDNIIKWLSGIVDFISGILSGDMDRALKGLCNVGIAILNTFIDLFNSFMVAILGAASWAFKKINNAASWLSEKLGINIPKLPDMSSFDPSQKAQKLPYLAQGAVIPPNREFLAVLGDQTIGTNIETPVETMKQAFRDVMAEFGNNNGGEYTFVAQIDGREIFRETVRQNQLYKQRIGSNAFA